jgi:hypothetical protein
MPSTHAQDISPFDRIANEILYEIMCFHAFLPDVDLCTIPPVCQVSRLWREISLSCWQFWLRTCVCRLEARIAFQPWAHWARGRHLIVTYSTAHRHGHDALKTCSAQSDYIGVMAFDINAAALRAFYPRNDLDYYNSLMKRALVQILNRTILSSTSIIDFRWRPDPAFDPRPVFTISRIHAPALERMSITDMIMTMDPYAATGVPHLTALELTRTAEEGYNNMIEFVHTLASCPSLERLSLEGALPFGRPLAEDGGLCLSRLVTLRIDDPLDRTIVFFRGVTAPRLRTCALRMGIKDQSMEAVYSSVRQLMRTLIIRGVRAIKEPVTIDLARDTDVHFVARWMSTLVEYTSTTPFGPQLDKTHYSIWTDTGNREGTSPPSLTIEFPAWRSPTATIEDTLTAAENALRPFILDPPSEEQRPRVINLRGLPDAIGLYVYGCSADVLRVDCLFEHMPDWLATEHEWLNHRMTVLELHRCRITRKTRAGLRALAKSFHLRLVGCVTIP